jgi:hypothetical protein
MLVEFLKYINFISVSDFSRRKRTLDQGGRHMAEEMAAILAFRDISGPLMGCLQGLGITSGLEEVDLGPFALEAGIIHLPVRPDRRHQERVAAKGAEIPDPLKITRDPKDPLAFLFRLHDFCNQMIVIGIVAKFGWTTCRRFLGRH